MILTAKRESNTPKGEQNRIVNVAKPIRSVSPMGFQVKLKQEGVHQIHAQKTIAPAKKNEKQSQQDMPLKRIVAQEKVQKTKSKTPKKEVKVSKIKEVSQNDVILTKTRGEREKEKQLKERLESLKNKKEEILRELSFSSQRSNLSSDPNRSYRFKEQAAKDRKLKEEARREKQKESVDLRDRVSEAKLLKKDSLSRSKMLAQNEKQEAARKLKEEKEQLKEKIQEQKQKEQETYRQQRLVVSVD